MILHDFRKKVVCRIHSIAFKNRFEEDLMISVLNQEAKYVERWPNTTSAWAGWSRFDIPVNRFGGVHSLLICTSSPLWFPTCHRASPQDNTY